MNKDLEILVHLQTIDAKIYELEQSKKEFPLEVERLRKVIADAEEHVSTIDNKVEATVTERREAAQAIAQAKESLDKSEERLNSITTNREYDAVHTEIESNKHIIANGDSRLSKLSDEAERLKVAREEAAQEHEEIKSEHQPTIDDLTSRIASIDSDIAAAQKERDDLAPTAYPPFLRAYEHILKRRKIPRILGIVSDITPTCSICHKILEAQLVNEVRKGLLLNLCESCGSILVWTTEEDKEMLRQPGIEPGKDEVIAEGFAGDDAEEDTEATEEQAESPEEASEADAAVVEAQTESEGDEESSTETDEEKPPAQ